VDLCVSKGTKQELKNCTKVHKEGSRVNVLNKITLRFSVDDSTRVAVDSLIDDLVHSDLSKQDIEEFIRELKKRHPYLKEKNNGK
jgi:hypothetical protein